jgi:lipopolysaccharide biosynthesis glycosyltransferase
MSVPKMNIAITLDVNYLQHAGVMICSLVQNNNAEAIDLYIICDDAITTQHWQKLEQVYNTTGLNVIKVKIDPALFAGYKLSDHATPANYYRIQMASLVPAAIDKILYMDVDIVINGDLRPLYDTDVTSYYMAAVEDPDICEKDQIGFTKDMPYFNSGIMVINLAMWRSTSLHLLLNDYILNNADKISYWDQDALNAVCYGKWFPLKPLYNVQTSLLHYKGDAITYTRDDIMVGVNRPVVVHYTGMTKPWQYVTFHPKKELYYKYLRKTPWRTFVPEDKTFANMLRKYNIMPKFLEKLIQGVK